jgi:hypothetical protein
VARLRRINLRWPGSASARARGFETMGQPQDAIRRWVVIQINYRDTAAAEFARREIERPKAVPRPQLPKRKPSAEKNPRQFDANLHRAPET